MIWLETPLDVLEERLSHTAREDRGVAAPADMSVRQIYALRAPLYAKYADVRIRCGEGVDGVGRIGQAEPMTRSELLATGELPVGFENVTVRFYVEGELYRTLTVPFGGALEALPHVEDRGGAAWIWDEFDASAIYCDTEVHGAYLEPIKTISSSRASSTPGRASTYSRARTCPSRASPRAATR